jgi:hypothetical protein
MTKVKLKTLKDIEKDYDDELAIFVDGKGEMPPLLNIKCGKCGNTNNFEWSGDEDFIRYYHRKMREVAREWIKESKKQLKDFEELKIECEKERKEGKAWGSLGQEVSGELYGEQCNNYINQLNARIFWIKHFFNLEDE